MESTKFNDISLETVDYYIDIIKSINGTDLNGFEKEIKEQIINYNKESNLVHDNPKDWLKINNNKIKNKNFRGNIFAVFNQVNKSLLNHDIRPIQLISLLFLTKSEIKLGGIFLQINTGEGKTLIIQFLAAYLALLGKKVDIISSSISLANIDATDKNIVNFYLNLGLTSGRASENEFDRNIVYGDTLNFEGAILKEEFKEENIRHNRPFDCVIIDEVDSISLDNIISMTQLTDNFPGRSCYQYFYYQILICFCEIMSGSPKITEQKDYKKIIHEQIKNMLKGKILEEDGKHLKNDIPILYPKSMKENIEESIDPWIDSTIRAFTMIENKEFIIKDNIVPVDHSNTGVPQINMILDRGLQQILQILFNTKFSFENENTNFLSNISFFKRYNGNIFGVTGTFGGPNFQYILRTVYEVKLYKIPPYAPSLLEDKGSYIFIDKENYINKILENINLIIEKQRSILLLCESIADGKEFYDLLNDNYKGNVLKYFTEEDNQTIENILTIGKIIVATNLAGRGTDIKISDELEKNGGLHVLVTFLPINQRVEEQNYGRAGRKGQKGSFMLVMLYKNEYGILNKEELNIDFIRQKRDKIELENIKYLINNEMKFILEKELVFKDFCHLLREECKDFNTYQKLNLLERWAKLLKSENIEEIKKNYELLKNDKKKKKIQNNLIKLKDLINYADDSQKFFTKIFDFEYEYSWAARIRYACLLAKEKTGLLHLSQFYNQEKAIEEFNKTKSIIDIFIGNLSCLTSLNKLVFSFMKKNEEKLKDSSFKTEIEKQNDKLKIFLETVKNLIDENIEIIQNYIQENEPKNRIEIDKLLTIEEIIKISKVLNIDDKFDIKVYMNEFGFQNFEVLIIKNNKKYFGNIIIITLGVLETCVGTMLIFYSSNPLVFKIARYLIREGIKDIIKGVKATVEGEEINLKSYALEKGVSLVGFALDLALGGSVDIGSSVKDRVFSIVKEECVNLVKTYANNYLANKIVKKIINILEKKLKSFIITPLMNNMIFDGENIEKCIQFDIINGTEENKNLILDNFDKMFEEMDGLIDFIGPIIELGKILVNKNNEEKFPKFLEFLSDFDYNKLSTIKDNISKIIKQSKICSKTDNNLSTFIKNLDPEYKDEIIDEICKELIECGVINKNGELNKKLSQIKEFEQCFKLNIDEKYMKYEYKEKKNISNELSKKLNLIFSKMNKVNLNNKKNEIKNEIYKKLENFIQSIIERILELIEDKVSEKLEKLYENYKKKRQNPNNQLDNENDFEVKKVKKKGNVNEQKEQYQLQVSKKSNNLEEGKFILPELNHKEIKKMINKEMKEKFVGLINERNSKKFLKAASKLCLKYGTQVGINNIIIPKLINILSVFLKEKIKSKLLPKMFERFDEYFEIFGEQIIILEKKYKFKGYIDKIIVKIRKSFHIITGIQIFVNPILKNFINKIKKGEDAHKILCDLNQELISKAENKILIPFKNFINEIFGEKGSIEKYNFFKKIIEEGYKKVKEIGIGEYEKLKLFVGEKKEEYKSIYLNKRKNICELSKGILKKYNNKKQELKRQYEDYKEKIINSTNKKIESLKKINFNIEFKKLSKILRDIIIDKLNELKKSAKDNINNMTSKLPKYFVSFIQLIDSILNLNFGTFQNERIIISENILNFILEIENGNIKLKYKNEKGEEIQENTKQLLMKYLEEKLEIKDINIKEIIEYLFKNGLKAIIKKRINTAIKFGQKKYDEIKKYYEPISNMIKSYFSILKEDAVKFIEKNKEKIDVKIDSGFNYFIKFINYLFNKANVLDLYNIKIEVHHTFKKDLINNLKKLRDIAISKITKNFELIAKDLEKQCDDKINKIESICDDKINRLVNKSENKIFGYLNKFIKEEDKNSKINKENKLINDENLTKKRDEINGNKSASTNDILVKIDSTRKDNSNAMNNNKKNEKDLFLNSNIQNTNDNLEYLFPSNIESDDEENLLELVEKADKELKEKDLKYNITRSNENRINFFIPHYEEDSDEYLSELYDYLYPNEKNLEKNSKENIIKFKENETNSSTITDDFDNKRTLNDRYNNHGIELKEINENEINKTFDVNDVENSKKILKNEIKNNCLNESANKDNLFTNVNNNTRNFDETKNYEDNLKRELNIKNNIEEEKEKDFVEEKNKNDDEKKLSEFEKFDKSIGKYVDKKIKKNASKFEQKMINFVKNSKTNEFLQKNLSGQMDRKKFDNILTSIENMKENEINFLQSDKIKNTCKNLDKNLKKIASSKTTDEIINFVDNFDAKKGNEYLDKFKSYTNLLDSKSKEQFRDNAKNLIQNEIFHLYEKYLEPKLKELAIKLGARIINKIGEKIIKKKIIFIKLNIKLFYFIDN